MMIRRMICVALCLLPPTIVWSQSWQSSIVYTGTNGKLVYIADGAGNRIPDFSYAGYKNGAIPIPDIAVVDSVNPVAGDNTTNIQNAINRVSSRPLDAYGFRGALLLKAGRYRVSGTLLLDVSGVVLRGVGKGSDSLTNTIILATGDSLTQSTVLIAGGGNGGSNNSAWSGSLTSNVNIVTDSVHVGDKTFQVASASQFSVGDNIIIYHDDTTPWKRAVDWGGVPNDTGITSYWAGVTIPIKYNRFITAVDGNNITIDAPVFNTLVRSLSQSYIYKTDRNNIKTNIGIENLRVDNNNPYNQSPTNSNGDERHHAQDAIWMGKIEDSWVRNCTALHFVHSGFITSIATRITIDSCTAIDPISIIDGSRRYNFNTDNASQLILFSNCYSSYGRHSYVSNGTSTVSGVVFYNCTAEETYAPSEGHRLWSQGLLYDNVKDINTNVPVSDHVLGLYNRGDMGSGHGWASAHSVAWNCSTGTRAVIIQKPPTAQNYAIGCSGNVTGIKPPAPFSHPQGYIEGTNASGLNPQSLYKAQFTERLSHLITATAGLNGTVNPSGVVTVNHGANQVFTFNPSAGYHVDSVIVDGVNQSVTSSYTFTNVQVDHTIRVVFGLNSYLITATAGDNGTINPSGVVAVNYGAEIMFAFNPSSGYHVDSVLVDGLGQAVDSSYTFTNVQANHTLRVVFGANSQVVSMNVEEGWSLISLPVAALSNGKTTLFPTALGSAFAFEGSYVQKDTLMNGKGYWLKFSKAETLSFTGVPIYCDTIDVSFGWNLIGSISQKTSVSSIITIPAGIISSSFFRYSSGYTVADTIETGKGYWAKAKETGKLILGLPGK